MSYFDPNMPPKKVLLTTGGVESIVHAPPPDEDPPSSIPKPHYPQAIVLPTNLSHEELDRIIRELCKEHRAFMLQILRSRSDVLEESAKDLAQNILVALWEYVRDEQKVPSNVRGFLVDLTEKEVIDHHRMKGRRPALDRDAEAKFVRDDGPSPEEAVDATQHMERVQRCLARLPHEQAEAIRYIDLLEQTLEMASKALQRPLPTVAAQRKRGLENLKELANGPDSEPPPAVRRRR